jgi:hypothetical protein
MANACSGRWFFVVALQACLACSALIPCALLLAEESSRGLLTGRVVTDEKQPIPQVRVDISSAAPKNGPAVYCPTCYRDCQKWAITDDKGEFQIADLDQTLAFRLVYSSPNFRTIQTGLVDPNAGLLEVVLTAKPPNADPTRIVSGLVKDERGVAIAGALVAPFGAAKHGSPRRERAEGIPPAVTDEKGHFEILTPEAVTGLDVEIVAAGTCGGRIYSIQPGAKASEIKLATGARVTGTLTRNGMPVAGMNVAVAQTNRNFDKRQSVFVQAIHAVTAEDGSFQFENLPPDEQYCIYSVVGEAKRSPSPYVVSTRVFHAPASEKVLDIGAIEVTDPVSIRGSIALARGETRPEQLKLRIKRELAWDLISFPVKDDGSFYLTNLPPEAYEIGLVGREYVLDPDQIVTLLQDEQSLRTAAGSSIDNLLLPIKPKSAAAMKDVPRTQRISGTVVAGDGEPIANILVSASDSVTSLGKGLFDGPVPWATTDKDGKFSLSDLPEIRVWLKVFHPLPDGERFQFLGMVQPQMSASDLRIVLDPNAWAEAPEIKGTVR